jgi:hypothetical protein
MEAEKNSDVEERFYFRETLTIVNLSQEAAKYAFEQI